MRGYKGEHRSDCSMKIEERPISDIQPYPKNAKRHTDKQVKQIVDSIREFGFNQPIVIDANGVIIVGHGRYMAAHLIGMEMVPTVSVDISPERAAAYRLADNKLNESEWDMDIVLEELKLLSGDMIDLTGFDRAEFDGKILAQEIDDLAKERDIDLGKYTVITVEAPEAPRLKARMSFYFESIEEFERVKAFFNPRGGALDASKLLQMVAKK